MPATFQIDHEHRLVRSRAWGILVDDDLRGTQQGLRDDPRFEPDYRQIYDFRDVTELRITAQGVRDLARASLFAPDARRAFVVANDVAFGMVRMFALAGNRDEQHFRPFRDYDEALRWIEDAP